MPFLFFWIMRWLYSEMTPGEQCLVLWQIIVFLLDTDLLFIWLMWALPREGQATWWFGAPDARGQQVLTNRGGVALLAFMVASGLIASFPGLPGPLGHEVLFAASFEGALIIPIVLAVPVLAFADCWRRDLVEWRRFFDARRSRRGEILAVFTSTIVMIGVAALAVYFVLSFVSF